MIFIEALNLLNPKWTGEWRKGDGEKGVASNEGFFIKIENGFAFSVKGHFVALLNIQMYSKKIDEEIP